MDDVNGVQMLIDGQWFKAYLRVEHKAFGDGVYVRLEPFNIREMLQ